MSKALTYVSTRNKQEPIDFYTAILQGIANDGGLLVPNFDLPQLSLKELMELDYPELASAVLKCFVPKDGHVLIEEACQAAYGGSLFPKEVVPVKKAGDLYIAELFQGPTAAFKDMALTLLPHLMTLSLKVKKEKREVMILAATSGDTGKAALEGFKDVEGTSIKVFYPSDGVSAIQKQQMITQEGKNVEVIGIDGNFDDAQTAVKQAFNDASVKEVSQAHQIFLSSANSINIGRLLPQIVYYFYTYLSLVKKQEIKLHDEVDFCIPSGNFGNALAGFIAKKMGLPVHKFICSSNKNNILTDFFTSGRYDANREFYKTNAPAMDILISSNLERLVWFLSDQNGDMVNQYMTNLKENGIYEVDAAIFDQTKEHFAAGFASEEEVLHAINDMYEQTGYLLDTHTATGYHVIKNYRQESADSLPVILLATASPYKFPEAVYKAVSQNEADEYDAIKKLHDLTQIEIPAPLIDLDQRDIRFKEVIKKESIVDFVKEKIMQK
ncbi:MAG: threonine synthase [Beduini sp.]|uniref:threonine synthase n=1 Tax=Beduini sp. TaxID=1922300 RepID=UPI0011C89DFC